MIKTILAVLGVVAALVVFSVASFVSAYNYGNRAEKEIVARYTDMENILAQYALKVQEIAQVPKMKTDDLIKVTKEAMSGRYGKDGSKSVVQWIQENYPGQVSDELYLQIQQVIESGRNEFKNAQRKFIDTKKTYETNLGYLWKGFLLRLAGYPKINLDEFQIISTENVREIFKTKTDKPIKLR